MGFLVSVMYSIFDRDVLRTVPEVKNQSYGYFRFVFLWEGDRFRSVLGTC